MYIQQGDVILKDCGFDTGLKEVLGDLLHKGESHHHRLSGGKFQMFDGDNGRFVKVDETCELTHEEHKTLTLKPGQYALSIVQEYDHLSEEARNVID